jgi:hypothetical protein
MKQEFAPYDRTLKLKELGFDEPCISYYTAYGNFSNDYSAPRKYNSEFELGSYISAPTFGQAFRWFREEHKLFVSIEYSTTSQTDFVITINKKAVNDARDRDYKTYEAAELAALDKLIEIVESKKEEQ